MNAAKAVGKVRMEGKDYVMQDGDVVEFRFNVWPPPPPPRGGRGLGGRCPPAGEGGGGGPRRSGAAIGTSSTQADRLGDR